MYFDSIYIKEKQENLYIFVNAHFSVKVYTIDKVSEKAVITELESNYL